LSKKQQKPSETVNKEPAKSSALAEPIDPEVDTGGDVLAGLDPKAVAILQELRRNPGSSMFKIAERLGIHRDTVADRIKSPRFQRALYEITLPAVDLLARYAPDAVRTLGRLSQSEDDKIADRASGRLLRHHLGVTVHVGRKAPTAPDGVNKYDSKELIKRWTDDLIQKQADDAAAEGD